MPTSGGLGDAAGCGQRWSVDGECPLQETQPAGPGSQRRSRGAAAPARAVRCPFTPAAHGRAAGAPPDRGAPGRHAAHPRGVGSPPGDAAARLRQRGRAAALRQRGRVEVPLVFPPEQAL